MNKDAVQKLGELQDGSLSDSLAQPKSWSVRQQKSKQRRPHTALDNTTPDAFYCVHVPALSKVSLGTQPQRYTYEDGNSVQTTEATAGPRTCCWSQRRGCGPRTSRPRIRPCKPW